MSISWLSAVSMLCWFAECFQFYNVVWLWKSLSGLGHELLWTAICLFQVVAYHPPNFGPSAFPVFTYWKFPWRSATCPSPPFLVYSEPPPLCCMFLLSSLFIIQVFFYGTGVSLSRGQCWFTLGVAVGILHATYLFACWSASPKDV
jgi:hypothetical protein